MKNKFTLWKIILVPIFILLLLHFLKDITQDVLGIPTILDLMGNIQEDISGFSQWLVWLYHWAWVNAFFIQPILLYLISKTWRSEKFGNNDKVILGLLGYIGVLIIIALLFV